MRHIRSRRERGNILVIVCVLAMVIFSALFGLGYLSRTDVIASSNQLREIAATGLAESIAAQIEARVNTYPWNERFWLTAAQGSGAATTGNGPPTLTFARGARFIDLSKDTIPEADYDFVGVIKDIPDTLREYRLYVEVTVKGQTYAFTWDKRWDLSLLVALNRDTTQMGKAMDDPAPSDSATDVLIDTIKQAADQAPPPPETTTPAVTKKLRKLRNEQKTFNATAWPGAPAEEPTFEAPKGEAEKGGSGRSK